MNSSSQKMWPRYASPCSPRAGTPASRSAVFGDTVCSRCSRCSRRMRNSSVKSSNSMDSRSHRCTQSVRCPSSNSANRPSRASQRCGVDAGFGRRDVAARVDGHDLLDRHRLAGRQPHRDVVTDLGVLVEQAIGGRDGLTVAPHGASRGHGDGDAGLGRLHGQQDRIVGESPAFRTDPRCWLARSR